MLALILTTARSLLPESVRDVRRTEPEERETCMESVVCAGDTKQMAKEEMRCGGRQGQKRKARVGACKELYE